MHVVVANEMDKRKDSVLLFSLGGVGHGGGAGGEARETNRIGAGGVGVGTAGGAADTRVVEAGQTAIGQGGGMAQRDWIQRPGSEPDIERLLIAELVVRHRAYVNEFLRPKTIQQQKFVM